MLKNESELNTFFIINSSLGHKEGEEIEKILYFYPPTIDVEKKKMAVGLSEAIIKFMNTFSPDNCEALHTQKTKQVFYQPEKDFWMILSVNVPYVQKTSSDGTKYFEYHGEQVQSKVLESVLAAAHKMFRFFMGKFSDLSIDILKLKLEKFFQPYIQQLNIPHLDVLDIFQGVQYLPLDRLSFLKVQCFVNHVEAHFPEIKQSVFLYNDQLIWNGISPNDMQTLYKYLVDTLLPEHIEKELQGGPHISAQHYGCFMSPPGGFSSPKDLLKVTRVHVNYDSPDPEIMFLVVYRALAATICFFIDGNTKLSLELMHKIDMFVSPQLSSLASEIGEHCKKDSGLMNQTDQSIPKYVYYNQLNVAYKSTVHLDNRHNGNISVDADVLKTIADISAERNRLEKYGEITIKTSNDYWIIGKVSNFREFYVVIHNKNANLKEIHEEVKKVLESKLKSIFFYPV